MLRLRNQRAASLAMVAALILVLIIVAVVAIQLITLFGGGQQVQRATDSGNLTAARQALINISVPLPNNGDQLQFNGVSDKVAGSTQGVVNLRNINRVMGQSLLVNLNAYAISQAGQDAGATTHASQINVAANNLGAALVDALTTSPSMQSSFSSTSNLQPTVQYGNTNLSPATRPTFSYLNRQTASNVYVAPTQMADYSFTTNSSATYTNKVAAWTTTVSSDPNNAYLKGYLDGMQPAPNFTPVHMIPLKPGDRPHLVSQAEFQQFSSAANGTNAFTWAIPVPNTLSIKATDKAQDNGYTGGFNAYAIVEPIDPVGFAAVIPHGFIRILNGAASPASGVAAGSSDVFVYTMNNPQTYPTGQSGALPYFVGANDGPFPMGRHFRRRLHPGNRRRQCPRIDFRS